MTLPPLMAVTEMRPGMSGRDFLTAAVAGYEIGPRVGKCMGPQHIGQGWHSGATVGVFSAAAGTAALSATPSQMPPTTPRPVHPTASTRLPACLIAHFCSRDWPS